MMDPVSTHELARIVQKHPTALTPGEIEFMKARRADLSPDQKLKFTSILDETAQATDPNAGASEEEKVALDRMRAEEHERMLRNGEGTVDFKTHRELDERDRRDASHPLQTQEQILAQTDPDFAKQQEKQSPDESPSAATNMTKAEVQEKLRAKKIDFKTSESKEDLIAKLNA